LPVGFMGIYELRVQALVARLLGVAKTMADD
jgi:hypothetical protein